MSIPRQYRFSLRFTQDSFRQKPAVQNDHFKVIHIDNTLEIPRFSVIISKHVVRGSVSRHGHKRQILSCLYRNCLKISPGDYLVILKKNVTPGNRQPFLDLASLVTSIKS